MTSMITGSLDSKVDATGAACCQSYWYLTQVDCGPKYCSAHEYESVCPRDQPEIEALATLRSVSRGAPRSCATSWYCSIRAFASIAVSAATTTNMHATPARATARRGRARTIGVGLLGRLELVSRVPISRRNN